MEHKPLPAAPTETHVGPLVGYSAVTGASCRPFERTSGAYTVTPDDFPAGCFVRTVNGKRYGTGENKLGITVTLPLDVPLCNGCDGELDAGVCRDCALVYLDVRDCGDDRFEVAA